MVKIEITGKMMLCEYASKEVLMEEAKDDLDSGENYDTAIERAWAGVNCVYFYLLSDIEVLANGEDITKKKGKYVMVENLVRSQLYTDSQPYPIEFRFIRTVDYSGSIELDVEDFDPKKLQLRKCTYEFDDIPYAIDAMNIIYDGELKELDVEEMFDYYDRWGYGKSQAIEIDAK